MKTLKKISIVYALQIFAVILLFSYKASSPGKETNSPVKEKNFPAEITKRSAVKLAADSLISSEINVFPGMYTGKAR